MDDATRYLASSAAVLWQAAACFGFWARGWADGQRLGLAREMLGAAARRAAALSVLPGFGAVLSTAVLGSWETLPLAWLRLSTAGNLQYELAAVWLSAQHPGAVADRAQAAAAWTALVGMLPGPLLALFPRRKYRVPRWTGRGWLLVMLAAFAAATCCYGAPEPTLLEHGLRRITLLYWPGAVVEYALCAPLLGVRASSLSFFAGSLTPVRLPSVLCARQVTGTQRGTPEGEAVGAVAAAVSTLTTLGFTAAGAAVLAPLSGNLTEWFAPLTSVAGYLIAALYLVPLACWVRRWWKKHCANKKAPG
jgi:hypothetical protein